MECKTSIEKGATKPPQWTVGMGITSQCNMKCRFCYSQDQRKVDDLETEVWTSFIKNNAALIQAINYGTGENTLSKTWYEVIRYVRENHPSILQALTTNGSLVKAIEDDSRAQTIYECIDEIDVSIDFANPARHDAIRGFTGAFDMTLRTLAYCRDHGKRATIVVLGQNETLEHTNLEQLFELAGSYGAFIRINLYRHVSDRSPFHSPDISTVYEALDWIIAHHTVVSISEPVFGSVYGVLTNENHKELLSARILPNGDITPSTYLITGEWATENIRNTILLDELVHSAPFERFIAQVLPEKCTDCPYATTCRGGTRDRRFLAWGSLDEPDIFCPWNTEGFVYEKKSSCPKVLQGSNTVHSDYLPTMIFSPGARGC